MTETNGDRVALFLPSLEGGGAERAATTLVAGLVDRGWRVDVVLARATGPFLERLDSKARVVDLRAYRVVAALPSLVRYLRRERPDVLLCSVSNANVVGVTSAAIARTGVRTVVIENTTLSQIARGTGKLRHRLVPPAARWAYPRADAVVAVSQGVADDLAPTASISRQAVTVIPNPVLTPELFSSAKEPIDHPWFADGEPPVVLGIGSLTGPKDFDNLITAFARLRQLRPARLLILGEGELRSKLESLIAKLGIKDDVLLPGWVQNPYPYLANASLLTLSSTCEGLPTVLIETLALGTHAVATECPSGPREILDGGRYGLLVAPENAEALASAMARALDDGTPGVPKEALAMYSLSAVLDQYEAVLRPREASSAKSTPANAGSAKWLVGEDA